MKLPELLSEIEWVNVEQRFIELYADQKKSIDGYKEVFNTVKTMPPSDTNMVLKLETIYDKVYDIEYVHVNSYKLGGDPESTYSLMIRKWNEVLGMKISDKVLQTFTELDVICHVMYEMTFAGFDEKQIATFSNDLE
ncbi:DUF6557 family protein [Saccharicrinis aurantiacus]|uniref:DUF6557 family protein n=1 Tax=Saccharicrinis aurantiacus TaxID=1849719 RepID=UPI00094F54AE|nr:DUF6557 family protein [Saccharicrinis aurantiacus]